MRVMLVTAAYKGHFNGFVAAAEELIAAGAEIVWVCTGIAADPSTRPQLEAVAARLGLRHIILDDWWTRASSEIIFQKQLNDAETRLTRIENFLLGADRGVERLVAIMRESSPAVVITDPMLYPAVIASELEGIPYVCVHTSLTAIAPDSVRCERARVEERVREKRADYFRRHGVEPPRVRRLLTLSPFLNTAWTTEEVLGRLATIPERTALVGPTFPRGPRADEPDFPWQLLREDRPRVYISFGTIYANRAPLLLAFAAAAVECGAQAIVSSSNATVREQAPRSPDCLVVPYAPQRELLSRVNVFVTHGGASSFMEGILAGVPQLVVPLGSDQPIQAWFARQARLGLDCPPEQVDARRAQELLAQLLKPPAEMTQAIAAATRSYRENPGARRLAREVMAGLHLTPHRGASS